MPIKPKIFFCPACKTPLTDPQRERMQEHMTRVDQGATPTSWADDIERAEKAEATLREELRTLERCADAIDADGGDCSISITIREVVRRLGQMGSEKIPAKT